jgi:hypothetical protein
MLLTHYAIRNSCARPRAKPGDPDRLSFTCSLRVIRRQVTTLAEMLDKLNERRHRTSSKRTTDTGPHTTGHPPATYTESPKLAALRLDVVGLVLPSVSYS